MAVYLFIWCAFVAVCCLVGFVSRFDDTDQSKSSMSEMFLVLVLATLGLIFSWRVM